MWFFWDGQFHWRLKVGVVFSTLPNLDHGEPATTQAQRFVRANVGIQPLSPKRDGILFFASLEVDSGGTAEWRDRSSVLAAASGLG